MCEIEFVTTCASAQNKLSTVLLMFVKIYFFLTDVERCVGIFFF